MLLPELKDLNLAGTIIKIGMIKMNASVLLGGAIGDSLGVPFETRLPTDPLLVNWADITF